MPAEEHRTLRRADGHYTIIANDALRDSRLSYRARGILAAALSHGSGFTLTRAWIDSHGTEGRDAITAAIGELRELGYVQDGFAGGHASIGRKLTWTDHPGAAPAGTRATENTCDEKHVARETRATCFQGHSKKTNVQEEQSLRRPMEEAPQAAQSPAPSKARSTKPTDPARTAQLPANLLPEDLADCHDLIRDWWSVKSKGRTSVALQRACTMLRAYSPAERAAMLSTAIVGGHQGLYPPKVQTPNRNATTNQRSAADWNALNGVSLY